MQALSLLVFCLLAIASLNGLAIRNKATSPTDTTPCSSNTSAAWLDIILIIDNSVNMGAANLKKISSALALSLTKFTIGTNYDFTSGTTNSRVAVLTYNYQASIVAKFDSIRNINDLTSTLNKITISNSPYADLYDPLLQILEWANTDETGPGVGGRPVVLLFFSASANAPVNSQVPDLIANNFDPYSTNVVTVNFNPSDANLTSLLNMITLNEFVLAPMYNLSGVSNTLSKDLEWALLQSNCFCGDGTGIPLILYDSTNSRYTRYATCMILDEAEGFLESINGICSGDGFVMPAYILTAGKEKFVEGVWNDCEGVSCYPFYHGLHKNAQSNWVWINWDSNDFPNNGYFDWGSGYPVNDGISNCTVIDAPDGINFIWRNTPCNTQYSLVLNILCQSYSCDAENTACVNNDYYNYDDQHSKMYKNPIKVQDNKAGSKRRQQMKYVRKNGKKNLKKNVHKKIVNKV